MLWVYVLHKGCGTGACMFLACWISQTPAILPDVSHSSNSMLL